MTYRFTSTALSELRDALLAYESKEQGLGGRFLAEVDGTIARILMAPEAWLRAVFLNGSVNPFSVRLDAQAPWRSSCSVMRMKE
jgi:hypothetical protein